MIAVGPWAQAARVHEDDDALADEPAVISEEPTRPGRDFETALGTRWAVWVGGLALALGGVFLVRYSIDAGIFGPRVRLAGAVLFGLVLAAAGEFARRRGFRSPVAGLSGAYVPAILTAASAFTLFASIYAAHGIYGFIGPTTAFLLLALVALATIGLSLLHGQALAGLGLLGSYVTPVLVASEAPSAWTLFLYLAVVQVAAIAIAGQRRWRFLSTAAIIGAGLWSLVYLRNPLASTPLRWWSRISPDWPRLRCCGWPEWSRRRSLPTPHRSPQASFPSSFPSFWCAASMQRQPRHPCGPRR